MLLLHVLDPFHQSWVELDRLMLMRFERTNERVRFKERTSTGKRFIFWLFRGKVEVTTMAIAEAADCVNDWLRLAHVCCCFPLSLSLSLTLSSQLAFDATKAHNPPPTFIHHTCCTPRSSRTQAAHRYGWRCEIVQVTHALTPTRAAFTVTLFRRANNR